MTREIANFFHENERELFTEKETPFTRQRLVKLTNDSVDPIQQVEADGERYYGVIDYDEHNGWYEYTRWDDSVGEVTVGVCAQCIKEHDSADAVARTLGDATDTARQKFAQHYDEAHTVDQHSVEVATGATLLSGTTINGNEAIHVGMDGAGSGVDADFVQGAEALETGVGLSFEEGQTIQTITQFPSPSGGPTGIGLDSADSIWHADYFPDSIYQLDQSGSTLSQFASPSGGPRGIGLDSSDSIWHADYFADSIYQLDQSGSTLSQFGSPSVFPTGIGLDSADSIWHADSSTDSIYQLDQSGSTLSQFPSPSSTAEGIGLDSADSIWHADADADSIYQLDQSGSTLSQFASPSSIPTGIGLDSSDSIWHADLSADSIYQLSQQPAITFK